MQCLLTVSFVVLSVPVLTLSSESQSTPFTSTQNYPPILQTLSHKRNDTAMNSERRSAILESKNAFPSQRKLIKDDYVNQNTSTSVEEIKEHLNESLNNQSSHGDTLEETTKPILLNLNRNYKPVEIAEYIYSTGDEKGFVQVVADMVEDGQIMASTDDLLLFLESVQRELATLRKNHQNIVD